MVKPEINNYGGSERKTFEPLPEDDYTAIIVSYRLVDRDNAQTGSDKWDASEREFLARDKVAWDKEQQEKADVDPSYHTKPWPPHRQFQYWFSLKVAEGEHRGRWLPRKKTTVVLSSFEKNGLFKFLKAIPGIEAKFASLAERIDAGDAPEFDEEVVNKAVKVTLEHNAKGYEKIAFIGKSKYKPTPEDIAELVLGARVMTDALADDDIPF